MFELIGLGCVIFVKIIALLCPLICIDGLIKEGLKTAPERVLVVFLVFIFGIFLYFLC